MANWTDAYIGREHSETYDCAALVLDVEREQFGRHVNVPSHRAFYKPGENHNDEIVKYAFTLADKVDVPQDGDVVLMFNRNGLNHIGIYVDIKGTQYVLHNIAKVGTILQKLKDITRYTLRFEGFYRPKENDEIDHKYVEKELHVDGTSNQNEQPAISGS